jgi:hypothetical protein
MRRGVNFSKKYRLNRLFSKKKRFKPDKTCQFCGLWLAAIYATSNTSSGGAKGCRKPAGARYCDNVGEAGVGGCRFSGNYQGFCPAYHREQITDRFQMSREVFPKKAISFYQYLY